MIGNGFFGRVTLGLGSTLSPSSVNGVFPDRSAERPLASVMIADLPSMIPGRVAQKRKAQTGRVSIAAEPNTFPRPHQERVLAIITDNPLLTVLEGNLRPAIPLCQPRFGDQPTIEGSRTTWILPIILSKPLPSAGLTAVLESRQSYTKILQNHEYVLNQ